LLRYLDYILADRYVVPLQYHADFSEQVVSLPYTYYVNDSKRAISAQVFSRDELGLPEQGFVFCCFNNSYKISPTLFDVWMRLLQQVPNSVLWLLEGNAIARQNLCVEAKKRGIAPERLVFAPKVASSVHLARHQHADLFLDTLPINAHTTACDALWARVPVVTCMGQTFASRVAASLLTAVGLPELITHNLADYEALALMIGYLAVSC
jgi:protein O-GlcNAc transferase